MQQALHGTFPRRPSIEALVRRLPWHFDLGTRFQTLRPWLYLLAHCRLQRQSPTEAEESAAVDSSSTYAKPLRPLENPQRSC
jgi:hypothetical protein